MIDEGSRHRLHLRLDDVLGNDEANVLMEYLPPVGWADVATKQDLQALKNELQTQMQALKNELLAAFRGETQKILFSMMAFFTALAGLFLAAAKLI